MDLLEGYTSCNSDESQERQEEQSKSQPCADSGNDGETNVPLKKRRKLNIQKSSPPRRGKVKVVDQTNHSGKLFERSVPHVRGNWAGHVFIQLEDAHVSSSVKRKLLREAHKSISTFQHELESAGWNGQIFSHYPLEKRTGVTYQLPTSSDDDSTTSSDDSDNDSGNYQASDSTKKGEKDNKGERGGLHVSLSRPFYLQLASIESFVRELKQCLSCESSTVLHLTSEPCVLVNKDNTRSFYGRKISPNPSILRLIHHVDQVLSKYQQPTYYVPPLLHTTLASVPGNVLNLLVDNEYDDDGRKDDNDCILIPVHRIRCKFGTTKEYVFELKNP